MIRSSRVFLLSPAWAGGPRSMMLLRQQANFDVAVRLRQGTASIGEIYTFISGLYFRGKMAYAEAFGAGNPSVPSTLVIVPGVGLVPPETHITIDQLEAIATVPVDEDNPTYMTALLNGATLLEQHAGSKCLYVLLGSVASAKYTKPLLRVFGDRLLFPADFVGRGDMSRGGLMLRSARSGTELAYIPVEGSTLNGSRPPKLERWRKP